MSKNLILTSGNQNLEVTNFLGLEERGSIIGLPLGTSNGTKTGELAVKTIVVGGQVTVGGTSFNIPPFTSQNFTYVGGGASNDDLIATQVFKNGSTTVGTLTYAYVGSTNNILSIVQS